MKSSSDKRYGTNYAAKTQVCVRENEALFAAPAMQPGPGKNLRKKPETGLGMHLRYTVKPPPVTVCTVRQADSYLSKAWDDSGATVNAPQDSGLKEAAIIMINRQFKRCKYPM